MDSLGDVLSGRQKLCSRPTAGSSAPLLLLLPSILVSVETSPRSAPLLWSLTAADSPPSPRCFYQVQSHNPLHLLPPFVPQNHFYSCLTSQRSSLCQEEVEVGGGGAGGWRRRVGGGGGWRCRRRWWVRELKSLYLVFGFFFALVWMVCPFSYQNVRASSQ